MTSNAILILKTIFNTAYSFMTSFVIPGTEHVTPLVLLLSASFTILALKFLKKVVLPNELS